MTDVERTCSFPPCDRKPHAKGLCPGHWNQQRKGHPLTPLRPIARVVDGMKYCRGCSQTLPVSEFTKKLDGYSSACRTCRMVAHKAWVYGISISEVEALLQQQRCDSCGAPASGKGLHIDHCHATGKVRGALCGTCNVALGMVNDSVETLSALIAYIERHRS